MTTFTSPHDALRHHVTGAVERGESEPIAEVPAHGIPDKATICAMLRTWINQRPGLEFGNYGDLAAYRSEQRSIARDKREALTLLRDVELRSISAAQVMEGFHAYSGRLQLQPHPKRPGAWELYYCVGQYWPTEYRRSACAVLAAVLWDHVRDHCMPAPDEGTAPPDANGWKDGPLYDGVNAGTWLRAYFVRTFGRTIGKRWFD